MVSDCMMMKTKKTVNEADEKSPPAEENGDFMQLRNRRLYKSSATGLMVIKKRQGKGGSLNSSISKAKAKTISRRNKKAEEKLEENVDGGKGPINYFDGVVENDEIEEGVHVGEILMPNDREIKERTPGNLVIRQDNIFTNDSSTIAPGDGVAASGSRINRRLQGGCIPSAKDIDNFFAAFELKQEKHFMEKYNFDFKNETPLPGRYEWVKVEP